MPRPNNEFNVKDFPSHDDVEDQIESEGEDLGNELSDDEDSDDKPEKKPAKKPAKKAAAPKEEEDEEGEGEDGEEEEEEEGEEEEEEEKGDPTLKRLEKKLARTSRARENLEAQVRELQSKLQQQEQSQSDASKARYDKLVTELEGLYESVEELRAEGKTAEAAKAQRRIDEIRDSMTRSQAAALATRDAMAQAEVRAFNTMVQELETIDERFDPESDEFDEELQDSLNELIEGYEAKGMLLTDALRKATKLLLREDVFARAKSLKREKPKVPERKAEPRKTDVPRNMKMAKKTPPEAPDATRERSYNDIDVEKMSDEDFAKLPKAVQDRLLGNTL